MVGNVVKGSTQDRLRAVFHICDEDKSGRIEKGELVDTFEVSIYTVCMLINH